MGTGTHPARLTPRKVGTNSPGSGSTRATRSPGFAPSCWSAAATCRERSASRAKLQSALLPSSATKVNPASLRSAARSRACDSVRSSTTVLLPHPAAERRPARVPTSRFY